MKFLSPRNRIAMGLTGVVIAVICLAKISDMIPDRDSIHIGTRANLTETIALSSSGILMDGKSSTLESFLRGVVDRSDQLISAGVRSDEKTLIFEVGNHGETWDLKDDSESTHSQMQVPIFKSADEKWGTIELQFVPLRQDGIIGYAYALDAPLMMFVGSTCFLLFSFLLKLVLKHLDPSNAVPQRVRDALDNLAEGLMILDNRKNILLANKSLALVVGIEPDKLLGKKFNRIKFACGDKAKALPWDIAIAEKRLVSNSRIQLNDADGTTRTFLTNCSPLLGHQGNYVGVMVTFDDVTKLEQSRIDLREAKNAADAANEAKSQFLANMSHEIRTPMNAILGFTDVLRKGMEENPSQRLEYLNTIHSSGNHLIRLINDILDLSKVEAGKLEIENHSFKLPMLLHEAVSVLSERANEKKLTLSFVVHNEIPTTATLDSTRMRQVLLNLIGNALKFTETGSVKLLCGYRNHHLFFQITDSGIGMTPDQQSRIFEAFSQADSSVTRRFGGTGLGLSISKKFIEAMGGTISVESKLGEGSTFLVVVPDKSKQQSETVDQAGCLEFIQANAERHDSGFKSKLNPSTILVVDDGETNRHIVSVVLKRHGLNIIEAVNGQEAVDIAMTQDIDVVLMDMQMPVMDGYCATKKLRDFGAKVPIIALTGNATSGERQHCLDIGCDQFLPKPIDIDLLVELIGEYVGFSDVPVNATHETSSEVVLEPAVTHAQATPLVQGSQDVVDSSVDSTSVDVSPNTTCEPWTSTLPMDDSEFHRIVSSFVSTLPGRLGEMVNSVEEQDFVALSSQVHWLKGAAGTVGLGKLTEPSLQLEIAAKAEDLGQCQLCLNTILALAAAIDIDCEVAVAL